MGETSPLTGVQAHPGVAVGRLEILLVLGRLNFLRDKALVVHMPLLSGAGAFTLLGPVVIDFLSYLNDLFDTVVLRSIVGSVLP